MTRERKTEHVGAFCTPDLKERVERAAREDHRSVSGFIRKMLREATEESSEEDQ